MCVKPSKQHDDIKTQLENNSPDSIHSEEAQFIFRALHHDVVGMVLNGSLVILVVGIVPGDPCAGMNRN